MNRSNLYGIDFNLLVIFETLFHERSMAGTAEKLSLKQPDVNAALKRLRTLLDDPLFEYIGRKMEPTAKAIRAAHMLTPALDSVCTAVSAMSNVKPMISPAKFHIGINLDIAPAPLFTLTKRITSAMPSAGLVVRYTSAEQMSEMLLSGDISVGVGHAPNLAPELQKTALGKTAICLVWRRVDESDPAEVWLRSELLTCFNEKT
jgi:LysR family transcriptional activator of mexEF-oprN operon